ncbi:MAG TPA: hypothetical protein VHY57_04280 [Rhizomicrobium sp.]|jgi:chorismate synthase|nr:hypothetical protein [Rhizomicrobium sp.]
MRGFICLAFLGSIIAMPAMAQSACVAPDTPAGIDGASVTLDELKAAIGAVKNFIARSDDYQDCLGKEVQASKSASDASKPDPDIAKRNQALADANQKAKESVGASVNAAIAAYKKAHPAR